MKKLYEILQAGDTLQAGDETHSEYSEWTKVSQCCYGFKVERGQLARRLDTPKKLVEPLYSVNFTGRHIKTLERFLDRIGVSSCCKEDYFMANDILMRLADKKEI